MKLMRDRLIAYEELERIMNYRDITNNHTIEKQSKEIIKKLEKIVKYNNLIEEWQTITHVVDETLLKEEDKK